MRTGTAELPTDWESWPVEAKLRLRDALRERLRPKWLDHARPDQLPPVGRWFVWLILAGRGWGKTRTGAEWAAEKARRFPGCRVALVAQMFGDGRDTMVEGESGLLSVLSDHELRGGDRDTAWNRSLGELFLANGSRFKIYSSEKPRQLRGPQHHFAWGDEPSTWLDASKGPAEDTTFSNLIFGCRLDIEGVDGSTSEPQVVLTGTPKPVRLLTQKPDGQNPPGLMHRESTVITRGHTDDNLSNLAPSFRREVVDPMRGTRLGRQELAAELLEDVEGALWSHATIDDYRTEERPVFWQRKVLGMDPSDGTEAGAEQGLCVAGIGSDWDIYVTRSEGLRLSGLEYCKHAINTAVEEDCSLIVVEKNHGGTYLVELLEQAMRLLGKRVAVKVVTAVRDKRARAEPVAAIYEQGKVRHLGHFVELEEQMTSFTGLGREESPDRLDAMVWALSELKGSNWHGAVEPEHDVAVPYTDKSPEHLGGAVAWT
jgi:predicted phage terminase large subunit-like protein